MQTCTHTHAFELPRPIAVAFSLFSPEGERHWVPGWDYENLMSCVELHEDYLVCNRTHDQGANDHGSATALWIVKRYESAAHRVEYYKIEPEQKLGTVRIACSAQAAARTRVEAIDMYLGLSRQGDAFVEGFTEAASADFIAEWERLLADYFQRQGDER